MNTNLILTIFIGFASLIVAFAILYIAFEMVKDSRAIKKTIKQSEEQQAAMTELLKEMQEVQKNMSTQQVVAPAQAVPTTIVVNAPASQPAQVIEPAPVEVTPAEEVTPVEVVAPVTNGQPEDENNVSFNAVQTQTLEEKYNLLPVKYQRFYDEIAKYAQQVEGHKVIKNNRYEEYKIASARLVRLLIKRGTVIAEFIFSNFDFKNYASENKISVKQAPTAIKIVDEEAVKVAKDSIDISLKSYFDEKEMKKELAKEKRKAKKEQQ